MPMPHVLCLLCLWRLCVVTGYVAVCSVMGMKVFKGGVGVYRDDEAALMLVSSVGYLCVLCSYVVLCSTVSLC